MAKSSWQLQRCLSRALVILFAVVIYMVRARRGTYPRLQKLVNVNLPGYLVHSKSHPQKRFVHVWGSNSKKLLKRWACTVWAI